MLTGCPSLGCLTPSPSTRNGNWISKGWTRKPVHSTCCHLQPSLPAACWGLQKVLLQLGTCEQRRGGGVSGVVVRQRGRPSNWEDSPTPTSGKAPASLTAWAVFGELPSMDQQDSQPAWTDRHGASTEAKTPWPPLCSTIKTLCSHQSFRNNYIWKELLSLSPKASLPHKLAHFSPTDCPLPGVLWSLCIPLPAKPGVSPARIKPFRSIPSPPGAHPAGDGQTPGETDIPQHHPRWVSSSPRPAAGKRYN